MTVTNQAAAATAPAFAHLNFPAYKYVEYPKIITLPDGKRATVQSAEEELELLKADQAEEQAGETSEEAEATEEQETTIEVPTPRGRRARG